MKTILTRLAAGIIVLIVGCGKQVSSDAQPLKKPDASASTTKEFAGSRSCRECHERFYKLWSPSHHGKAMQPYNDEFAKNFLAVNDKDIVAGKTPFRAYVGPGEGYMVERNPKGDIRYPIVHVTGGKNVFYLLTKTDRGRYQVLPLAYDVRRKEWYDTTQSMLRHFHEEGDQALSWRDSMLTFNTACYNCHVSQLSKNYDVKTDTYHTMWKEPGINCETCHGPSSEHNRVCREAAKKGKTPKDLKIISTTTMTPVQRDEMCAPCHAKMTPITSGFTPGDRYFDNYDLAAFEDRDFSPDGRDLGENYTFTLWLTNPCVKAGKLECLHCHTSSGRFRFKDEPNKSCLPCHQKRVENIKAHSHHKTEEKSPTCISCHMPMTEFARMRRSDHSLRPPTPAATIAFKSPNACNICHKKKSATWADTKVRKWHKEDYQAPIIARAALIKAAREHKWEKLPQILAFIDNPKSDSIFVMSLIRLLGGCHDARKWPAILRAIKSKHPIIRASAAAELQALRTPEAIIALLGATGDDFRLVRIRAAYSLAGYSRDQVPESMRAAFDKAKSELIASLKGNPDSWSSYYNMGNYYSSSGDLNGARDAYALSVRLRPDVIMPLVNGATVLSRLNDNVTAEQYLRQAKKVEPKHAAVNFNLGLLLAEKGKMSEAAACLRQALKTDPTMSGAAYNLAIIVGDRDPAGAVKLCRQAVKHAPEDPKYGHTLGIYLLKAGKPDEAIKELKALVAKHPAARDPIVVKSMILLASTYREQGKKAEARDIFEQIRDNSRLPAQLRQDAARAADALK